MAGHYAITSLFEDYGDQTRIYCYDVERENFSVETAGRQHLAAGRARFSSEITRESATVSFDVLHLGDHNIAAGVRHSDAASDDALKKRLSVAFARADTTEAMRILDEEFKGNTFSLRSLFRDEQRKIMALILDDALGSTGAVYREIYEKQSPLLRFLTGLGIPVPATLHSAAEIALNSELRDAFDRPELEIPDIRNHLKEAAMSAVNLDVTTLEYSIRRRLERKARDFAAKPDDLQSLKNIKDLLAFALSLPFPVVLWEVQNVCYGPIIRRIGECSAEAEKGSPDAKRWMLELGYLQDLLRIRRIVA